MITAGISFLGVFATYLSVRKMGKQVGIQKSQWEYSQKPIFKIINFVVFNSTSVFIVENSNEIFHLIESVTYTSSDVLLENSMQGAIKSKSSKSGVVEESVGLSIILTPQVDTFTEGVIQIRGVDILGNNFICNSPTIKFENRDVINRHDFFKIYFKFI